MCCIHLEWNFIHLGDIGQTKWKIGEVASVAQNLAKSYYSWSSRTLPRHSDKILVKINHPKVICFPTSERYFKRTLQEPSPNLFTNIRKVLVLGIIISFTWISERQRHCCGQPCSMLPVVN